MINTLFKDRTGMVLQDFMYPRKIEHKTPKDLFSMYFTHGEATSIAINGETFSLTTGDAMALFSKSHTFAYNGSTSYSNILNSWAALSQDSFMDATRLLWRLGSVPDTIITSTESSMVQKAKELIKYFDIKMGWKLEHMVCPELKADKKYRWFVADSRKSTAHYKKLPCNISEVCVFTFDWIVGSMSETRPCLDYDITNA
jgi:hypothetical protein